MTRVALDAVDAWLAVMRDVASPAGQLYTAGWNESKRQGGFGMERDEQLAETILTTLGASEIYAPRPDILTTVSAAAEGVPWHPVLAGDEPCADRGFVHLTEPLSVPQRGTDSDGIVHDGMTMRYHAIQWWRTGTTATSETRTLRSASDSCVALVAYGRLDDDLDDYSRVILSDPRYDAIRDRAPRWEVTSLRLYPSDQLLSWDIPATERVIVPREGWEERTPESLLVRWALAFWTVVRDLAETTVEGMPRAARRRLARTVGGGERRPNLINVVDLRRRTRSTAATGDHPVDWTHRWPVRPHWRHQYYPSTGQHHLRLIPPHIKGPPDKPLIVKPTVFDLKGPPP